MRIALSRIWWLSAYCMAGLAHAASITQVTPQGASQDVQQVVVQFSADVVPLGDPQASAPVQLQCDPSAVAEGSGRWNDAREWVWQFRQPLPAGTRCTVSRSKTFRLPSGAPLGGMGSYAFSVSGPAVINTWPSTYEAIDEEQMFVLQLNGVPTPQSLQQHVYCKAQDLGERIPVQVLDTAVVDQLRKALQIEGTGPYVGVQCQRRLTGGTQMQLVYGAGVEMAGGMRHGSTSVLEFQVREPFTAQLQCERERANAGCLPIRDLRLNFSAPVPRKQALQVQLVLDGNAHPPVLEPGDTVGELRFSAPFRPEGRYQLQLPAQLQDDAGRQLANASSFPMAVQMGPTPPLLKFAAAPFGVLERFAEGEDGAAVLPLTVRHVEAMDGTQDTGAQLRMLRLDGDADIIRWWNLVQRYDRGWIDRKQAQHDVATTLPPPAEPSRESLETRTVGLLKGRAEAQTLRLPRPEAGDPRPFEVVGVALQQPGYYVLEAESPRLGQALLDEQLGAGRSMFVRTSALVTNLAVHLKLGREGSAVWVTSLDRGQPVADARVQVSDCRGKVHASGQTSAEGLLLLPDLGKEAPSCDGHAGSGQWFVSARHDAGGAQDVAFVWSDWQRGIEPWRFNLPVGWGAEPGLVAHTVLDRNLVRAGEKVSMKHFVRQQTLQGLTLPASWPREAVITHVGSGQQYRHKLQWEASHNGGRSAVSSFDVPPAARLGQYTVELVWPEAGDDGQRVMQSGSFRVEAFRLPVFQGSVQPADGKGPLVAPAVLDVAVQLSFLDGGAASAYPVQVSALLRDHDVAFERWSGFSFRTPRAEDESDRGDDLPRDDGSPRLIADKLPLTLDRQGQGQVQLRELPPVRSAQRLLLEASFADPNGEIQTLRSTHTLWPAAVVAGLRTEGWLSAGRRMRLQALALDTHGRPQAQVPLKVEAVHHTTATTRKRLVGGFYSYDNQHSRKSLGQVCSGKSDAQGLLQCEVPLLEAGEVELIVTAEDSQGRTSQAADTVWVSGQGELWFGGQDHDRMDVLPEKDSYAPGDIARLQVRMPFREATALVSVEREGVLQTQVVRLQGKDPVIELPVQADWGPNVYVSVLALRGRLYEVPWYSFFTWGYRAPRQWWDAFWHGGKEYVAPTAMVDLSKPAFRLGVAELTVRDSSNQLQVAVQADRHRYQVRDRARVSIRVSTPDGKPAAHAEVAVAAVDKALLELWPNTSWDLRSAMWQRRDWAVETATAQMEVVGRRHYGRKAAAPGGGGGAGAPTRELLDTLLLWLPRVQLDAQGQAEVEVPLNDALSSFTIVAVADDGVQRFGTGSVEIATSQDLQLISGLPPVVREGDQLLAVLTLRNTTTEPMRVQLTPRAQGLQLKAQTVELPAQQARQLQWEVSVPALPAQASQGAWPWEMEARDELSGAQDRLALQLRLLPAVPLQVQQASLQRIDGHWTQTVSWPRDALPQQGGIRLSFSSRLADPVQGVPGLRQWWAAYPYACLEQTVGKAIGLGDLPLWQRTMAQLPTYLDDDGLAMYFPVQGQGVARGSDTLTAYLLSVNRLLQTVDARFALPEAERSRMESGLIAFVEGRIERVFWSPRADLEMRKLSAIAALADSGKARAAMLESIRIAPQEWPTHAVIDWLHILQRMPQLPARSRRMEEAQQLLRQRLFYTGTLAGLRTEESDRWWWLMQGADVNLARLLLVTMEDPAWEAERARLVSGLIARQQNGSWQTTVANTWAGLALRAFSQRYEADDVSGSTTALLGAATQTVHWDDAAATAAPQGAQPPHDLFFPWGDARQSPLNVQHRGHGQPWMSFQSVAAVPRTQPLNAGYVVKKTVQHLQSPQAQHWTQGDIARVRLEVQASADMTWVALTDPIPAGASILGSGLGRDSEIAVQGEGRQDTGAWPRFVERGQESYRVYWDYLPRGTTVVEYTLRLNSAGAFMLPPTQVQALYAPDMAGELPNARWEVQPAP